MIKRVMYDIDFPCKAKQPKWSNTRRRKEKEKKKGN